MEQLTQRHLRALLELLPEFYAARDLDAFSAYVVLAVREVVPCEISSYNEIDRRLRRIAWVVEPPGSKAPGSERVFEQYMHEHPFLAYRQRTHDEGALKFSDFLTRSELHRLALYNEFYRPMGVKDHMSIPLRIRPPASVVVALCRDRKDFSEQDRLRLNLLGPHLVQAHRNAEAVTRARQELALVAEGVEALDRGVMVLSGQGRVRLATGRARRGLAEYFGGRSLAGSRLPEVLKRWVRHEEALLGRVDELPPPRRPLVVEQAGKRLVVRLVSATGQHLLLFEEQQTGIEPTSLEPLGLTRRETQVLALVAEGKGNEEVGRHLSISPRTVQKHLEHVYRKLGVETRTAALAHALKAAGRSD